MLLDSMVCLKDIKIDVEEYLKEAIEPYFSELDDPQIPGSSHQLSEPWPSLFVQQEGEPLLSSQ